MNRSHRLVLPLWIFALAAFLIAGAIWSVVQVAEHQKQLTIRGQLDLGERVVEAKVALWREESLAGASAVARDPLLLRAVQSGHREALEATLIAGMRKASAQRGFWYPKRSDARVEVVAADIKAREAALSAVVVTALNQIADEASRQGKAQQVVVQSTQRVWNVGAVELPGESGVVVLMFELPGRLQKESTALGLDLAMEFLPEESQAKVQDYHSRHLFIPEASAGRLAIAIKPKEIKVNSLDLPMVTITLLLLGAFGLSAGLWWSAQQPLRDLRVVTQQLASSPEKSLRQLKLPSDTPDWRGLQAALAQAAELLAKRESHWRKLALHDPLTALPNATMVHDRLGKTLQKAGRTQRAVAVLRIDLKEFRYLNTSFGYAAGDQLLKEVSERIRSLLRGVNSPSRLRTDSRSASEGEWLQPAVGRLGGDDFVAILPDCDAAQAQRVAARVIDALGRPFSVQGQQYSIKIHVGIASAPEHAEDATSMLRAAETALTSARTTQRPSVIFSTDHEKERERQVSLLGELRQALAGNELLLAYQPKIDLRNPGRLRVEALVRWEHPERGLQSPAEFVPFAERTGFIVQLTRWVIDHALNQVTLWQREGMDVQIAVNLSVADVRSEDFPTFVIERLRFYKLPAECLTVEITESALSNEPETVRNCLKVLDNYGVKLAIDDFAGGAAALSYLDELPVSVVKLDRSLITGMHGDAARQTLVRSSIEFAHQRGLQVMAEGVEDASTLELLRSFRCDFAQGYYFGKPLRAEAYPDWVAHQARRFTASSGNFTELAVGI